MRPYINANDLLRTRSSLEGGWDTAIVLCLAVRSVLQEKDCGRKGRAET